MSQMQIFSKHFVICTIHSNPFIKLTSTPGVSYQQFASSIYSFEEELFELLATYFLDILHFNIARKLRVENISYLPDLARKLLHIRPKLVGLL